MNASQRPACLGFIDEIIRKREVRANFFVVDAISTSSAFTGWRKA